MVSRLHTAAGSAGSLGTEPACPCSAALAVRAQAMHRQSARKSRTVGAMVLVSCQGDQAAKVENSLVLQQLQQLDVLVFTEDDLKQQWGYERSSYWESPSQAEMPQVSVRFPSNLRAQSACHVHLCVKYAALELADARALHACGPL